MPHFPKSHGHSRELWGGRVARRRSHVGATPIAEDRERDTSTDADAERLRSHLVFVRKWITDSADLLSWAQTATVDSTRAMTGKLHHVSGSFLDESCSGESDASHNASQLDGKLDARQLDGVESEFVAIQAKLEKLKLGWHLRSAASNTCRSSSTLCSSQASETNSSSGCCPAVYMKGLRVHEVPPPQRGPHAFIQTADGFLTR